MFFLYPGDCNEILLQKVFPNIKYKDYKRGLCILDPYGLHLNWNVIEKAGALKTIDLFLNFPTLDMNRNVFWKNPKEVSKYNLGRMNSFWGDDSWKEIIYQPSLDLFSADEFTKIATYKQIVDAFKRRLTDKAGFRYVPEPLPMRNSKGNIIYFLFFASQSETGSKIAEDIFNKYRKIY